jgi:hypothetical protein
MPNTVSALSPAVIGNEPQFNQSGFREQNGIVIFVSASSQRVGIAAQVDDRNVGPQPFDLPHAGRRWCRPRPPARRQTTRLPHHQDIGVDRPTQHRCQGNNVSLTR